MIKIKDVINYIQTTPHNTNRAILKSMLEDLITDTIARNENELYSYTVDDDIASDTDLLGKVIEDFQGPITIKEDVVYGELKYVTDYTGFSGKPEEQSGYYLVFHVELPETVTGATIKVNGVTLDSDGIYIMRLIDNVLPEKQKFIVEITKGNSKATDTYTLEGITLQ